MGNTGYVRALYASQYCRRCKGVGGRHWHGCRHHPDALERERRAVCNNLTDGDLGALGLVRLDGIIRTPSTAPVEEVRPAWKSEIIEIPPGCYVLPFGEHPVLHPVLPGCSVRLIARPQIPTRIVRLVIQDPETWELGNVKVGRDSVLASPDPIPGTALTRGVPLPDAPVVQICQDVSVALTNLGSEPAVPMAWLVAHRATLVPRGVEGDRPVTRREHCEQLARYLQAHADDTAAFGSLRNPSEPVRYAQEMLGFAHSEQDGNVGPNVRAQCRKYGVALPPRPGAAYMRVQITATGRGPGATLTAEHPAHCRCSDCVEDRPNVEQRPAHPAAVFVAGLMAGGRAGCVR